MTTSEAATRRRKASCPAVARRLIARLRWPRLKWKPGTRKLSPSGGSTLITSAPSFAIRVPAYGPARIAPRSSTRRLASGPPGRVSPGAGLPGGGGGQFDRPPGHDRPAGGRVVGRGALAQARGLLVGEPAVPAVHG